MKDFRGKLVMVTGSASGIGRAIAMLFCKEGADLALVDIDMEGLESLAREIEGLGGKAHLYVADLRDHEQVAELKRKLQGDAGIPDVLVNAAGVAIVCCVEEASLDDWHWVLDLNLWGCINVVHAFLADMFASGSGHVVNMASVAGLFAVPYQAPYSTSKHALMGLTESIRQEGKRHGVSATAVCPGAIRTPIIDSARLIGFSDSVTEMAHHITGSPEKLATAILAGVKKNKPVVLYPGYAKVLYGLKRISLRLADVLGAIVAKGFYSRHRVKQTTGKLPRCVKGSFQQALCGKTGNLRVSIPRRRPLLASLRPSSDD